MELQNFTSWSVGRHFIKIGGRLRYVRVDSISPANFGGTYTFAGGLGPKLDANDQIVAGVNGLPEQIEISSLERYRRTLAFGRQGLAAPAIRLLGGGATQLSIAGGNPEALVNQADVSFYFQDEWKLTPHFTLSPGLRYENQDNIDSDFNFAPRIACAWSPVFARKTPAKTVDSKIASPAATTGATVATTTAAAPAQPAGQPKTVFRGGIGIFYNRVSEELTLQATRFNGTNQQQFLVTDPTVLDLFPIVPPVGLLNAFSQPQNRRVLSADLGPVRSLRIQFAVERQLLKGIKLSFNYSHSHTLDTLRTVNINAPLSGTFVPGLPTSGVRPLGQSAGNVLQSQSTGRSIGNSFSINVNGTVRKINFWGGYNLGKSRNTDGGTSGSPFDPYDFNNEWARASSSTLNFFTAGATIKRRTGLVSTFLSSRIPVSLSISSLDATRMVIRSSRSVRRLLLT